MFSSQEAAAIVEVYRLAAVANFAEAEDLAVRALALKAAGMAILERAAWVASRVSDPEYIPPAPESEDIAF